MGFFAEIPLYVWLPALFVLATPFEVGLVIFLISRFSGWVGWAQRFPAGPVPPEGTVYPWCSARVGKWRARYNRVLAVTVSGAGLHVAPRFFVKLFHPPLLLPWACVRGVGVGAGRGMGGNGLEVNCEADGIFFILYLPPEAAGAVAAWHPGA